MKVLAIDPGLSGAVALIGDGEIEVARDFKRRSDITAAITRLGPRADTAVKEFVSAMPGQGVTSMFNFGKADGAAESALVSCGFYSTGYFPKGTPIMTAVQCHKPFIEVTPQRWQNFYWDLAGVSRAKGCRRDFDSIATARRFLPQAGQFLTRKKDHNTADALLIGYWLLLNPGADSSRK